MLIGAFGLGITGALTYTRLLYLGLLVVAASWLWTWSSLQRIKIVRQARSLRASVGDIFEEHFEIVNQSRYPRWWLEVANESSLPSAAGSRVLTALRGLQKRTYIARTWLVRRGAFSLGPTVIAAGDPFGLFRIRKIIPANDSLLVLPLIVPIKNFPIPPGLLPGGKAIRRKSHDVTPHAFGVREYVAGDSLKRIHWPASAKHDQLMVKEFEQDPQSEIWLFLDAQRTAQAELPYTEPEGRIDGLFNKRPRISLPPSTLEYGVCITASLAHYFIEQRRAVGLVCSGQVNTLIPSERSERQEFKILETLAFVQGDGNLSLAGLIAMQTRSLPRGSTAILVTPTTKDDILFAVDELKRSNVNSVVVLLQAAAFGGKGNSEKIRQALEQRAVPVCSITYDDNIAEVFALFAAQHNYQEISGWQRPVSIHWT